MKEKQKFVLVSLFSSSVSHQLQHFKYCDHALACLHQIITYATFVFETNDQTFQKYFDIKAHMLGLL